MLYKAHTREGLYVVELRDPLPMLAPPGQENAWDVIECMLGKQVVILEQPSSIWVKV
jgi:hypothetical protein